MDFSGFAAKFHLVGPSRKKTNPAMRTVAILLDSIELRLVICLFSLLCDIALLPSLSSETRRVRM